MCYPDGMAESDLNDCSFLHTEKWQECPGCAKDIELDGRGFNYYCDDCDEYWKVEYFYQQDWDFDYDEEREYA